MKKIILALLVLVGVVAGAQAETLKEAYDQIAAVKGGKTYDQAQTAQNLDQLNSNLPMIACESVSWPFEKGSAGVTAGFDRLQSLLDKVTDAQSLINVESDYNTFLLLASPSDSDNNVSDVMAVWQMNFYGEVYVVYGQMTNADLNLLQLGDVQMTHYGVSIRPMPKAYYEQLTRLQKLQTMIRADRKDRRPGVLRRYEKKFKALETTLTKESEKK